MPARYARGMNESHAAAYEQLVSHARQTALLTTVESALDWDERTYMPPAAGPYRAEQITFLAGMIHARAPIRDSASGSTSCRTARLAADRHSDTGATIHELKRQYDKLVKLPQALVEELARTALLGQQAWVHGPGRQRFRLLPADAGKNDSAQARASRCARLSRVPLRCAARRLRAGGADARKLPPCCRRCGSGLAPLVAAIAESGRQSKIDILTRHYPIDAQRRFGEAAAARIGFDFRRGRLDVTAHPFCTQLGPHDCRLTTRYDEHHFPGAFFGILHEAGHGLYEQGLRPDAFGLPPGEAISLGIHESQSRMWENLVGRSRAFWDYFFPQAQQAFPEALADVALDDFYFAINDVRPSLIRVEADEATYNLHILIRFELEQALLNDDLSRRRSAGARGTKNIANCSASRRRRSRRSAARHPLERGLIGYFPTYSLGNLYASQFFEQADRDLGGLAAQFARGEFAPLLDWLRSKIHRAGRCYTAAELVATGHRQAAFARTAAGPLARKFGPLYEI